MDHAAPPRNLSGTGLRHRLAVLGAVALLYEGGSDLQSLRRSPLVIVLQTLGVTAPLISAIVVTGLTRGKRGVRRLLGGLKRWRVGLWWYAAACLLLPVLTVLGIGLPESARCRSGRPGRSALAAVLADIGWIGLVLTFPLLLVLQCFGSRYWKNPGWRGFVYRVRRRMPAAWAAFLVGAIWGLWHVRYSWPWTRTGISLVLITMHGFFLGWLYLNTSSLLIAVLGHASLGVANNSLSLPDQGIVQIVLTLALCMLILAFFRVSDLRPRLGSTSSRARQRVSE